MREEMDNFNCIASTVISIPSHHKLSLDARIREYDDGVKKDSEKLSNPSVLRDITNNKFTEEEGKPKCRNSRWKNEVARERWKILAKALLRHRKNTCRNYNVKDISVRRFASFGLVTPTKLEKVEKIDGCWLKYTAKHFSNIYHVEIHHLEPKLTPKELIGFNNTGNICIWPSEEVLAYYLLCKIHLFEGKDVLEIGGGMTCLAGLMLAKYGKVRKIDLTDGNLMSVENVKEIISRNKLNKMNVSSFQLDWVDHGRLTKEYDFVLSSDCLFFDETRADLVETIWNSLGGEGVALVMAPKRGNTLDCFVEMAAARGFYCVLLTYYEETIWKQHLKFKEFSQEYEEDLHHPILLLLTKSKTKVAVNRGFLASESATFRDIIKSVPRGLSDRAQEGTSTGRTLLASGRNLIPRQFEATVRGGCPTPLSDALSSGPTSRRGNGSNLPPRTLSCPASANWLSSRPIFLILIFICNTTDYWVSQGRKFCEFCKCSIADNKPSIQFHENGKKHKENVAKRLTEMQKKAAKEAKDAVDFDKEMKRVEAAALKAYMNDVKSNADYTSQLIRTGIETLPEPEIVEPAPSKPKSSGRKPEKRPPPNTKKWMEAVSEDGKTYYWNVDTGESTWDCPEAGFMTLAEQEKKKTSKPSKGHPKHGKKHKKHGKFSSSKHRPKPAEKKPEEKEEKIEFPLPYTPPFGKWKKVEPPKPEKVDLQLPKQEWVEITVPKLKEQGEKSFKEKTSTPGFVSSSQGETGFKKRKIAADAKRNMRQRLDDD